MNSLPVDHATVSPLTSEMGLNAPNFKQTADIVSVLWTTDAKSTNHYNADENRQGTSSRMHYAEVGHA